MRNMDEAEDVLREAFIFVCISFAGSLAWRQWLRTIVVNTALRRSLDMRADESGLKIVDGDPRIPLRLVEV